MTVVAAVMGEGNHLVVWRHLEWGWLFLWWLRGVKGGLSNISIFLFLLRTPQPKLESAVPRDAPWQTEMLVSWNVVATTMESQALKPNWGPVWNIPKPGLESGPVFPLS